MQVNSNDANPFIINGTYNVVKRPFRKPVSELLKKVTKELFFNESNRLAALRQAVYECNETRFIELAGQNSFSATEINSNDSLGLTMLTVACYKGKLSLVKQLFYLGADCTPSNRRGVKAAAPLSAACHKGHVKIVKFLLRMGADANERQVDRGLYFASPLSIACEKNFVNCIKLLLEYGADPKNVDGQHPNPIYCALKSGHIESVDLLLSYGADLHDVHSDMDRTVLSAAKKGHYKLVAYLVHRASLNINYKNPKNGNTALFEAYGYKQKKTVRLLKALGADKKITNNLNQTFRIYGKERRQVQAFKALSEAFESGECSERLWNYHISSIYEINARDLFGNTLLHYALVYPLQNIKWIRELLKRKASLSLYNKEYLTPYNLFRKLLNEWVDESTSNLYYRLFCELSLQTDKDIQDFYEVAWLLNNRIFTFEKIVALYHKIEHLKDVTKFTADGESLLQIAEKQEILNVPAIIQLLRRGIVDSLGIKEAVKFYHSLSTSKYKPHEKKAIFKVIDTTPVKDEEQKQIVDEVYRHLVRGTLTKDIWEKSYKLIDVNLTTSDGNCLLFGSIIHTIKYIMVTIDLLERCANPFMKNNMGFTVIDLLLEQRGVIIIKEAFKTVLGFYPHSGMDKFLVGIYFREIVDEIPKALLRINCKYKELNN